MLRRHHHRRTAFSLVEVLVSMFIVAAGLIALMSLFPLGAVQMGKALQSDRAQNTCVQADARFREIWRQRVVETNFGDPYYLALEADPDGAAGPLPAIGNTEHRPSYPVLFDPIGCVSYSFAKQTTVSGVAPPAAGFAAFPRRTYPVTPSLTTAVRLCTLPDDLEFAADGTPADADGNPVHTTGNAIFHQHRYTWAVAIQRPDNSVRTVANQKVLVFDRRAAGVNPPDNELVRTTATSESSNAGQLRPGDTTLTFNEGNETLGVRLGTWIMDGTISVDAGGNGIRNMNFYRVTDYSEAGGTTTVKLHVPVAKPTGEWVLPPAPQGYAAQLYILRELIDVFDRPLLAPNGYQKQTP